MRFLGLIFVLFLSSGAEAQQQFRAVLKGSEIENMSEVHSALAKQLRLSKHYRANLDALYDILVQAKAPVTIIIQEGKTLHKRLGTFETDTLMETLNDAADINMKITIDYQP